MARLTMIVLVGPRNFEEILEKKIHLKMEMNVILKISWGKTLDNGDERLLI